MGPTRDTQAGKTVQFESRTDCLSGQPIQEKLRALLQQHDHDSSLSVAVVADPATQGSVISLRVIVNRTGAVILDRSFTLLPQDCPSAPDLLAVVLERFLQETPSEQWQEPPLPLPPPPEKVLVLQDMAQMAGMAYLSLDSRWPTPSADLELGTTIDVGSSRHRLIGSLALRLGMPRSLGGGHYLEGLALLGLGWRYASEGWILRVEVRTGGLLVSGYGYQTNYHDWLLWIEGQCTLAWEWRGLLIGPQIAVSALHHQVVAGAGQRETLPWLRVGLFVGFPYWYNRF